MGQLLAAFTCVAFIVFDLFYVILLDAKPFKTSSNDSGSNGYKLQLSLTLKIVTIHLKKDTKSFVLSSFCFEIPVKSLAVEANKGDSFC